MPSFDISATHLDVEVRAGEAVELTFSVTSFIAEDVDVQAELTGTGGRGWVSLSGTYPMRFEARGTRQLTARVAPPAGEAKQLLDLGLSVFSVRNPNEVGASPAVRVRVKGDERPFPWWIVAVVAAVLLIGGGVAAWLATRPPKVEALALGAACGGELPGRCAEPGVCEAGRCLIPAGKSGCTKPEDCATGACADGVCGTPLPLLGQVCSPSSGCASAELTCSAGRCRLITGKSGCTKAEDCVSQGCEGGVCVLPDTGAPCLQGQCREGHACTTRDGGQVCLRTEGQACTASGQCVSGFCDKGAGCKAERPRTVRTAPLEANSLQHPKDLKRVAIEPGWRYVSHDVREVRKAGRAQAGARTLKQGERVVAVEGVAEARSGFPPAAIEAILTVIMEKDDP